MKKLTAIGLIVIAPIFGLMLASVHVAVLIFAPSSAPETSFTIRPGETFSKINFRLEKEKIISSSRIFHHYARLTKGLEAFKTGTYEIPAGMSMKDVLETLTSGKGLLTKITIPEGKNIYEISSMLSRIISPEKFLKAAKSPKLLKELGIPGPSVEGHLFPETYMVDANVDEISLIKTMVRQFRKATKNVDYTKAPKLTPQEVITLASIVEKETGAGHERATIAGVYLNRLRKGMRLESDPTTIYGLYPGFNGNLTRKNLRTKSPYNTYRMKGLPRGPICNPGLAAIQAVLNPEEHNYIFFVSKNDGTHVFSENYDQHRKAVHKFQKTRANREGKSWRDLKQ